MTLGIAFCVRSALGSSVISVIPYVFTEAGAKGLAPAMTIGQYTYCINALFVVLQIAILRRQFEPVQLFQLLLGFIFGMMIDGGCRSPHGLCLWGCCSRREHS